MTVFLVHEIAEKQHAFIAEMSALLELFLMDTHRENISVLHEHRHPAFQRGRFLFQRYLKSSLVD